MSFKRSGNPIWKSLRLCEVFSPVCCVQTSRCNVWLTLTLSRSFRASGQGLSFGLSLCLSRLHVISDVMSLALCPHGSQAPQHLLAIVDCWLQRLPAWQWFRFITAISTRSAGALFVSNVLNEWYSLCTYLYYICTERGTNSELFLEQLPN